ncbi:hypothetical protein TRVA0_004S01860 [Trichomonascus vanleenenianus]|uniref:PalH/RIM21 family protein n=1 Tax=Trichomonascus vanleenenianus TaxID=2268995 RepID=UPI003ECB38CA
MAGAPHWPGALERNPIWRDQSYYTTTFAACDPLTLPTGTILYRSATVTIGDAAATFTPLCRQGRPVTIVDNIPGLQLITTNRSSWQEWISSDQGGFHASLYPMLYSLSSSVIICLLLNFVVLDGPYRPFLQKLSITLSSVYLLVTFITATVALREQYNQGYLDAERLRRDLESKTRINVLYLVFNTFVYMAMVQTLMALFPRQKEKRLIFWVGAALIVVCQTLWGVSVFHQADDESALPAFVYLFQISVSVMYAGCVVYYTITKHRATLHKRMMLFTLITIMATLAPIALFIVDVGGWWIVESTDSVSWLTNVLSIAVVWEWAQRVETWLRHEERNGVLGRQVYENDMAYPSVKSINGHSGDDEPGGDVEVVELTELDNSGIALSIDRIVLDSPNSSSSNEATGLYRSMRRVVSPIVWISDQLIELGYFKLRIRSSSVQYTADDDSSPHSDNEDRQDEIQKFVYPMRKT